MWKKVTTIFDIAVSNNRWRRKTLYFRDLFLSLKTTKNDKFWCWIFEISLSSPSQIPDDNKDESLRCLEVINAESACQSSLSVWQLHIHDTPVHHLFVESDACSVYSIPPASASFSRVISPFSSFSSLFLMLFFPSLPLFSLILHTIS